MVLAGALHKRLGTTELTGLGGVARHAPFMASAFFVAGLASIGMPGTSGFLGEFALLSGIFEVGYWAGIFALLGVILGAGYVLWYYERAFFGPATSDDVRNMRDLNSQERRGVGTVLAVVLVAGLAPMFIVPTVSTTTNDLAQALELQAASMQTASTEAGN